MSETSPSELLLYQSQDGEVRIDVRFEDESVWLTQASIAELYQTTPQNITIHIRAIYEEEELAEEATCKPYLQVRQEGARQVKRSLKHYGLPMILAIGFRVRSARATLFRQWATAHLEEYLVKGFTMDDERLKNPPGTGAPDYFDELLARLRAIRTSEKRFYKTILEVYATSMDYDSKSEAAREFFAKVQNKMHWAVHGHTAAEVIAERACASKPNMGLTTWPGEVPRKADARVAKNYLSREELEPLESIVSAYLEFAKLQAEGRRSMYMKDWATKLDDFLALSDYEVLAHAGRVSAEAAKLAADREFGKYQEQQRALPSQVERDFEETLAEMNLLEAARKKEGDYE